MSRQSRLALLVYATIALVTVVWVALNQMASRQMQARFDIQSELLANLKRKALIDAGRRTSPFADSDAATMSAPSETVAASMLQRYLLERLGGAGGSVQSVQAEAGRETGPPGLRRLSAQVAFDATMPALQRFLFDLETGLPFVFVESLAAQSGPVPQPGTRTGDKVIRAAVTVTSYWKVEEGAGVGR
jgi:general secretion pathway protein M